MANVYDMSDTWNDGATTFTSIKMNVTDTASGASSLLLDLQVSGVSKASVNKNGQAYFAGLNDFNPDIRFGPTASVGIGQYTNNSVFIHISGEKPLLMYRSGTDKRVQLAKDYFLGWQPVSGGTTAAGATRLYQDADYTLAQRNGTNAQTFNLYNTYTDASNYERGFMKWNSNVLQIGTEAAGTGSGRSLTLRTPSGSQITLQSDVRIANAAGTQSWRIDTNFFPITNNAVDFGSTSSRIRTGFFATSIVNSGFSEMAEMTAPAAPATNNVRIYAEDDGAGKTRLMARFATGAAVQIAIEP